MNKGRVTGEDSLDSEWSIGQDKPRVQQVCVADSLSIVYGHGAGYTRTEHLTFFPYFGKWSAILIIGYSITLKNHMRESMVFHLQNCEYSRTQGCIQVCTLQPLQCTMFPIFINPIRQSRCALGILYIL